MVRISKKPQKIQTHKNSITTKKGSVVQLDRISDFGSEGWGFESLPGHKKRQTLIGLPFFFIYVLQELISYSSRSV